MKKLILILSFALTGCTTCYYPTDPVARRPSTGYMVVNNSGVNVNVIQDGQVIAEKVEPGQVVPVRPVWLRTSCVVVVGYTSDGAYVGSADYIFQSGVRETWMVSYLAPPQTPLRW